MQLLYIYVVLRCLNSTINFVWQDRTISYIPFLHIHVNANLSLTHRWIHGSRLRCGVAMHIEKASAGDPLGSINDWGRFYSNGWQMTLCEKCFIQQSGNFLAKPKYVKAFECPVYIDSNFLFVASDASGIRLGLSWKCI